MGGQDASSRGEGTCRASPCPHPASLAGAGVRTHAPEPPRRTAQTEYYTAGTPPERRPSIGPNTVGGGRLYNRAALPNGRPAFITGYDDILSLRCRCSPACPTRQR